MLEYYQVIFMVVKTKKGYFQILKNVKEAFDIQVFEECYIEEWYDQFTYIVGDISDSKLRLKGFKTNPSAKEYYEYIPDYLIEACNYKPKYFILKKSTEQYYEEHKDDKETDEITKGDTEVPHIEKEAFDKDSLTLLHTPKNSPHIVLDMNNLNAVKTYPLPDDLANEILKDKQAELNQRRHKQNNRPRNNNR